MAKNPAAARDFRRSGIGNRLERLNKKRAENPDDGERHRTGNTGLSPAWMKFPSKTFVVGVLQRLTDLRHDVQRLAGLEPAGPHGLAEIHAVNVFHEQVEESAGLPIVVNGDDIWVTGLIPEPRRRRGYS